MAAGIKVDTRAWNQTFNKYVELRRKKTRQELIEHKAQQYAYFAFQELPATDPSRIDGDLLTGKIPRLLLRLAVLRLIKKGVELKGRALTKTGRLKKRRKVKGGGSKRPLTPGNILVRIEARKIRASRRRSSGYHRVAYLLLSQMIRGNVTAQFSGRSRLSKTNASIQNRADITIARLVAAARGIDCPSTHKASDFALREVERDMIVYIERKLREAKHDAGFKR